MGKEGVLIEKREKKGTGFTKADAAQGGPIGAGAAQQGGGRAQDRPRQIYDRIFKRIFSLSDTAIISLINGLFGRDFPLDSTVSYPNREFVLPSLGSRIADVIVVVNGTHAFHLEAQMEKDDTIVLRAFEYGFFHALSTQGEPSCLVFPEPAIVYLSHADGIPEEGVLRLSFGSQGSFDYHVKNYLCLAHGTEELTRRRMAVLLPFQALRLRSMVAKCLDARERGADFDMGEFCRLREGLRNDILDSIRLNLELGNITADDSRQLLELTDRLYAHILRDFGTLGGDEGMKPLLPGALELPNDKYRFRIDELERDIARYADENARYADENARYADENAKYADEVIRLKKRIAELENRPT